MPEREADSVLIRDWPGLIANGDSLGAPLGAGHLQVNLQSERPGEMRVRRGISLVRFDDLGLVELLDIVSVRESLSVIRS